MELDRSAQHETLLHTAHDHAEEAQRNTRRLMLMSRGLILAITGLFFCALALFAWVSEVLPGLHAWALPMSVVGGVVLSTLLLGIERARARTTCHVRTLRQATWREHLLLGAVILSGVVVLLLLLNCLPPTFDCDWIWLGFLGFFGVASSGYFLFLSKRLRLFEPALLGLGLLAFCLIGVWTHFVTLSEAQTQSLLLWLESGFGLLALTAGLSLHRRWVAWRTQTMTATGEEQA